MSLGCFASCWRYRTVSRISLVKPQKAQGITNLIIQMAQQGQIRQKVNEAQLIGLLEQVERAQGEGGQGGGAGKITVSTAWSEQASGLARRESRRSEETEIHPSLLRPV